MASQHLVHKARGIGRSLGHHVLPRVLSPSSPSIDSFASSSSPTPAPASPYTNDTLLLAFLIACAVLLGAFALAAHPRLLARVLAGPSAGELKRGWMLSRSERAGGGGGGRKESLIAGPQGGMVKSVSDCSLSSDKTLFTPFYTPATLPYASRPRQTHRSLKPLILGSPPSTTPLGRLPPYFPSFLPNVLLHPLPKLLHVFYLKNLTIGQALLLTVYGTCCLLATFWYSNPYTDPTRSGVIATAQIPLIVALGMKNSPVGLILGKGAEKVNFLHRFLGRTIFFGSTVHAAVYFRKWDLAHVSFLTKAHNPVFLSAFASYFGLCVVTIASIPPIRKLAFEFFYVCHWLGYMTFMVALYFHAPLCRPFCLAGLALYAFDQLSRLAYKKSFFPLEATLVPLSDGQTTLIDIPSVKGGWRAGQYVNVRILPGTGMGWTSLVQKHPFTIGSAPRLGGEGEGGDGEGLRLFVKNAGGWTGELYRVASAREADWERGVGRREVKVLLDGPYGGPGHMLLSSFSDVLLLSGGSGISTSLAMAATLQAAARTGGVRANKLDLCWVVQTEVQLIAFLPFLLPLIDDASPSPSTSSSAIDLKAKYAFADDPKSTSMSRQGSNDEKLSFEARRNRLTVVVHVYLSRATASSTGEDVKSQIPYHPRLVVHTGRPDLAHLLDSKVDSILTSNARRTSSGGVVNPSGLAVGVCGPTRMVLSVREAIGGLGVKRSNDVGGVELCTESFGM